MKRFFEKLNRNANLISALSVIASIIGSAIALNFKVTLYGLVAIVIAAIVGFVFLAILGIIFSLVNTSQYGSAGAAASVGDISGGLDADKSDDEDFDDEEDFDCELFDDDEFETTSNKAIEDFAKQPLRWMFFQLGYKSIAILILFSAITGGLIYGAIALIKANWPVFAIISAVVLVIFIVPLIIGNKISLDDDNVAVKKSISIVRDRKTITKSQLDKLFDDYREKLSDTIEESNTPKNIILHMLKNTKETTEFFKLCKNDAKKSSNTSIVFAALGFSLIIFAIVWGVVSQNSTPTVISSIGGVVTDVFAVTAYIFRKQSLSQLNYYFDRLMRDQDILLSVKMVERLHKNQRDEMYIKIIENVLANTSNPGIQIATGKSIKIP